MNRKSENDIGMMKVTKTELGRTLAAGQRGAIIYTLLESCRRRGINQREYLLDVLTRLPTMKITEVAELTPARWLAAKRSAGKNQAA